MGYFGTRLSIDATAGCKNESADSEPFADVGKGKHTAIVAAIGKADIEIASWISDETCNPYHGFTTAQVRYYLVAVGNVDFQAAEKWVTAKWTQSVVAEPVCINRYNFEPLADKKSTKSAP
jgi:hypothetical protein